MSVALSYSVASRTMKNSIRQGDFKFIKQLTNLDNFEVDGPCVVLASPDTLENGFYEPAFGTRVLAALVIIRALPDRWCKNFYFFFAACYGLFLSVLALWCSSELPKMLMNPPTGELPACLTRVRANSTSLVSSARIDAIRHELVHLTPEMSPAASLVTSRSLG